MKKILHIFPDSLFIESYIEMLKNDEENTHQFILTDIGAKVEYDIFKNPNIKFDKVSTFCFSDIFKLSKMLKLYEYDLLIIHSLYLNYLILPFIFNKKILNKTVLSLWGGSDSRKFKVSEENKKYFVQAMIYEFLRRPIYKRVKIITSIVPQDFEEIKRLYKVKAINMPIIYPFLPGLSDQVNIKSDGKIHIQVGHSGSVDTNSIEILELLKRFSKENIIIHCPLSYGNKDYITEVCKKGKELFGNKFVPQLEIMAANRYKEYIAQMDILVMNTLIQQGLGNINLAFCCGNKVYINNKSKLWNYLKTEGFYINNINDIKTSGLDELIKISPKDVKNNRQIALKQFGSQDSLKLWINVFKYLRIGGI